ncbi:MAG: TonB-dependent receptor [Acidobacteria bacterium]|nr:TonB-dependent receptor [Acidobacteriota bacterium]
MPPATSPALRRRLLRSSVAIVAFAAFACHAATVGAQLVGANLGGVITDQSGGALPGVTVTVTNRGTGFEHVLVTEADGKFRVVAMQPGAYDVIADLTGFTPQRRQITLTVGADATLNLVLDVGALSETVMVSASAALVEVTRSQPSSAVVGDQIAALPVLERNFLSLAQLLPGAAPDQRPNRFSITKFGGAADQRNSFTTIIDGGDIDDVVQGNPTINLSQDAVQEFKVFRNQFDAQYGNALTAVVAVVSKSGTNQFHGSGYYFGRDDALNAKNAFARAKPEYQQGRVGGSVGGPALRNRTFFFTSYEYNDVNDVRIIALPANNPFASAENGTFPSGKTNHLFNTKVDHRFNDRHSMFARYAFDDQFTLRSGNPSSDSRQGDDFSTTHSVVAEGTSVLSDRLVNSLRVHFLTQNVGTLAHSTAAGVTRPSISTGPGPTWPQYFPRKKTTVGETVYYTAARHDIKAGADYSYSTGSYESHANETGQFTFTTDLPFDVNNRATWPISLVMQTPGKYSFASSQIALYAQDNWRIADRVRLNLGLRYDYDTDLRHEKFYKDLLANPAYAGIENFVSSDRGNDTNNLQPRVGATWDVFGTTRLVARAGYGMYVTRNRPYFQMVTQDGTLSSAVRIEDPARLSRYPDINAILGGQSLSEFVSTGARSVLLLSNDYVLPYQHNFTLGAGWQLTPSSSLDIDLVRGEGRKQLGSVDRNLPASGAISAANPRPVSRFTVVKSIENFTDSQYDALEMQFRTRVRGTDSLQVSYTLSRTYLMGVTHYATFRGTQRTPQEEGYSGQDTRHNLSIAASTSLPWGFEVSGILKALSGAPYNVQAGFDLDGDGQTQGDRPRGLPITVGREDVDESLAIINALRATRNLAPVNGDLLKLEPYVSLDGRITKAFAMPGGNSLQLFAEGYNLTNVVNLSSTPNGNIISTSFLVRNNAADARQVQFGARFVF